MKRNHLSAVENKALFKEEQYVILCMSPEMDDSEEDLYWSDYMGWVSLPGATRYSKEESLNVRMPLDGQWVNLTRMTEHWEMSRANHPTSYKPRPELRVIEGADATQHPELG